MQSYNQNTEHRVAGIALRAAILIVGLVSIPVAIVWLPVFGLFFSALLVGLALSPNLFVPREGTVKVLVGSRTHDYLKANRLIPVTILPAQQQSFTAGHGALGVIPDSVRLEHSDMEPVYGPNTQDTPAAYVPRVNGDGAPDMVFYFSEEAIPGTDSENICITAKTTDGSSVRGCAPMEEHG